MPDNFFSNTGIPTPDYGAKSLVDFSGLNPATKQPVSNAPAAQQPNPGQNLGAAIGKWLQQYQQNMQRINPNLPPAGSGAPHPLVAPGAASNAPVNPYNTTGGLIY